MGGDEKKEGNRLHQGMKYRPTLIIGLGGVGTNVAKHAFKWIRALTNQEKLPPFIKILGFDTDTQEEWGPSLVHDVQFFNLGGFSAGRLLSAAKNRRDDAKLAYLKPFIESEIKPGQIHRGVGGIPLLSHLCYAYNRSKKVIPPLSKAVMDLLDPTLPYAVKNSELAFDSGNPTLSIHIITSVCGGTGAGILFDMAFDIRQLVLQYSNSDPDMTAHLVLPPIFHGQFNALGSQHNRNAYYVLRQFDHLMGTGRAQEAISTEYSNGKKSGLSEYEILFNTVYLTNQRIKNKSMTEDHIGRMMAAFSLEPIGMYIGSIWQNLESDKLGEDPVHAYSGYGLKTFKLPSETEKEELVKIEFVKGVTKFIKENIVEADPNEEDVNKARKYIDSISNDNIEHLTEDDIRMHRSKNTLSEVLKLKKKDEEVKREFWEKTWGNIVSSGNINLLPAIFKCATLDEAKVKDDYKNKENNFNALSDQFKKEKIAAQVLINTAKIINALKSKQIIIKSVADNQGILSGTQLKKGIEDYLKEKEQVDASEGFLDKDVTTLVDPESDFALTVRDELWLGEYVSLAKRLTEKSPDSGSVLPGYKIKSFFDDEEKGFCSSTEAKKEMDSYKMDFMKKIIPGGTSKIRERMERPGIEPFLLYEVTGGTEVDAIPFIQSSLGEGKNDDEQSYLPCYVSDNCDWIICKSNMGFELDDIKDLAGDYREAFEDALRKPSQSRLWRKPLYRIEKKQMEEGKGSSDNEYEFLSSIFKLNNDIINEVKELEKKNKENKK